MLFSRLAWGFVLVLVGCGDPEQAPQEPPTSSASSTAVASVLTSSSARPPDRAQANRAVLDALKKAIDTQYSYRDRLGLDWNALFAAATPDIERATSREALVQLLVKLLSNARDAHMNIVVDGKPTATDPTNIEWNFSLEQIKKKAKDLKPVGRCLAVGHVEDFAYVLVNGLEKGKCDDLPQDWAALYPQIIDTPGMILDLRGNAGGDEEKAQKMAGYFVEKPTPYVMAQVRDQNAPNGFRPAQTRVLQPVTVAKRYASPVVVLSGRYVGSSAEAFVLMMRAAGKPLLGSRTRGASANPVSVDLGSGIQVQVPTWRALLLDGTPYEGVGIAPDIEVPVTQAEVASSDKVIDAAVAELKKRKAK